MFKTPSASILSIVFISISILNGIYNVRAQEAKAQEPAQSGCMCNENSFEQTACAKRPDKVKPSAKEQMARREIQGRINLTIESDKRKDVEAAMRFNTPDFTAKSIRTGAVLTLAEVKQGIQANYNYILQVRDETRVNIDCLILAGDEATVYINQHFVRTVPYGDDKSPHLLITNVTHKEIWVRTPLGWMRKYIEELVGGPYYMNGKPFDP